MPLDVEPPNPDKELCAKSIDGLSIDQLTRSRLAFALAQNQNIYHQIQLADAKAAALLAVAGTAAAQITRTDSGEPWMRIGLIALNGVIIAVCFWVLLPRLRSLGSRRELYKKDHYGWLSLVGRDYDSDAHADFLINAQAADLLRSTARANAVIASVLLDKFQLLRLAFVLAVIDVAGLLAIAML